MISFKQTKDKLLKDPAFKAEYEKAKVELETEFALLDSLKQARNESKLTQAEIAQRMGTKQSAVARLEAGVFNAKLDTIIRYARAIGLKELKIAL